MARCKTCGATEDQADFYASIATYCKVHWRAMVAKNRKANIEKCRAYDRARGNRQGYSYVKEYRAANPEKYKAHTMVGNAVRGGRLVKLPCIVCGLKKSVAHHEDYSKPLDVVWYCQAHHKERHKQMKILGIEP